jgi:hypothetical protein
MKGLLSVLAALLFATSCQKEDGGPVAGTESGTGIQGTLALEGNTPATGADVYLYARASVLSAGDSALFLRVLDNPDTLRDTALFRGAVTDGQGRYRFENLAAGNYALIGLYGDSAGGGKWVGFLPRLRVEAKSVTDAGLLSLKRLGGVSALVGVDHQPAENVKCQIPGLSFVAYTDEAGKCLLLNVPEGAYTIKFELAGFLARSVAGVAVEAGKITALPDTVELARDPSGPPPSPQNLVIALDTAERILTLRWDPSGVSDVVGYIVYRKSLDSLFRIDAPPLTDTLIRGTWFTDTLYKRLPDTAGVTYFYRIEASDKDGKASEPASYEPVTVPPAAHPIRIEFASPEYAAKEGDSAAVLWVRRAGPSARPVGVKWSFEDSSAARDSDFIPVTGELQFGPGDTLLPLRVPIAGDLRMEGPEVFRVRLSHPGNGAVWGDNAAARVTIADDDSLSLLGCADTLYAVRESDTAAVLTVRRGGETRRAVSLQYRTRAGSARDSSDFLAASGAVTLDSGETAKSFSIRIVNDTVEERAESFRVDLTAPSRDAEIRGCASAEVLIADDDSNYTAVPLDLSKAAFSHNLVHGDPVEFPSQLFDKDTVWPAVTEFRSSASELLPMPIADWDFKDCGQKEIKDLSGNQHAGVVGGSLGCRSDSAGSWALFDGNDSVTVASHPAFSFVDSFTVTAWVRPDSLKGLQTLVSKFYAPNSFSLSLVDGEYRFEVDFPDDSTWWGTGPVVAAPAAAGVWQHVAGVYDGRSIKIYVDGMLVKEALAHGAMMLSDRPITIGYYPSWSSFHGGMREVRLFNKALDIDGIWEQAHLGKFPPRPMELTAAFDAPQLVLGAGVYLSSQAGSTKYRWTLAGADSPEDLDGRKGSYAVLADNLAAPGDGWARAAFRPKAFKLFRYVIAGAGGNGHVRVNEVSLSGARRVTLP